MLRVTAYDKLRTRIRMLADGRMKSHCMLLGPPGVGKTVAGKECWPQSDEETHRYEDVMGGSAASRRRSRRIAGRSPGWNGSGRRHSASRRERRRRRPRGTWRRSRA